MTEEPDRLDDSEPVVLKGGIANAGAVLRIGETVRRPAAPQVEFVHDFMRHLRSQGCDFVPEPIGFDSQDREVLRWVPGDSASDPWPDWVADDDLLVSVAQVQRSLHQAASSYEPDPAAPWAVTAGDYFPQGASGSLMCHNDLSLTNVVVSNRTVAGVIDWDFAAPANPLFDLMVTARHWVPFAPPARRIESLADADAERRWTLFADTHELDETQRKAALALAPKFIEQAARNIAKLAERDGPDSGYQALLDRGYLNSVADTLEWIRASTLWAAP